MNATNDVGSVEHAAKMYRIIPNSDLVIRPGIHGEYLGALESVNNGRHTESCSVTLIEQFLDKD